MPLSDADANADYCDVGVVGADGGAAADVAGTDEDGAADAADDADDDCWDGGGGGVQQLQRRRLGEQQPLQRHVPLWQRWRSR